MAAGQAAVERVEVGTQGGDGTLDEPLAAGAVRRRGRPGAAGGDHPGGDELGSHVGGEGGRPGERSGRRLAAVTADDHAVERRERRPGAVPGDRRVGHRDHRAQDRGGEPAGHPGTERLGEPAAGGPADDDEVGVVLVGGAGEHLRRPAVVDDHPVLHPGDEEGPAPLRVDARADLVAPARPGPVAGQRQRTPEVGRVAARLERVDGDHLDLRHRAEPGAPLEQACGELGAVDAGDDAEPPAHRGERCHHLELGTSGHPPSSSAHPSTSDQRGRGRDVDVSLMAPCIAWTIRGCGTWHHS